MHGKLIRQQHTVWFAELDDACQAYLIEIKMKRRSRLGSEDWDNDWWDENWQEQ